MKLPATFAGRRRWVFTRLLLNGLVQAALLIVTAVVIKHTVDTFIVSPAPDVSSPELLVLAVSLVALGLVAAWLRGIERVDAEALGQNYVDRVRRRMFKHLARLSPRAMSHRSRGDVLLRFVGDLGAVRRWLSMGLSRLVVASLLTGLTAIALGIINWKLAATVFGLLLLGVGVTLLLGGPLESAIRESRRRRSYLAGNIAEKSSAMIVVQAHGRQSTEQQRMKRQSGKLRNAMLHRAALIGLLRALSEGTVRITIAAAVIVGAYEVASGAATAGTIVAAISVVAFIAAPLRDLSRVYDYWHAARVSREKLENFLQLPEVIREAKKTVPLQPGPGELRFRNVFVEGGLHNFSATARAGEFTAIVGPNASGKSTLIWLAARLLDPDQGRVLLDGQPLRKLSIEDLRQAISILSPDIELLKGSVEKNIRYRDPAASDAELQRVCELCRLEDVLMDLPGGLRSRIGEGGRNLSLGQRQRISLARALLGNPRVLLMDEPDQGLDATARSVLDDVLQRFDGTLLMVTHDPERARVADRVWELERGQLLRRMSGESYRRAITNNSSGDVKQMSDEKVLRRVGGR